MIIKYKKKYLPAVCALITCFSVLSLPLSVTAQDDQPWLKIPAVQEVLAQRKKDIEALIAGKAGADPDAYTSTFVANTPDRGVILREEMLEFLATGTVGYDDVEMHIDYAGAHGNNMVVIMGEEIVVPGKGMRDAGKRVHRRFTDVFRKENGLWRHDLRHANVTKVE